MNILLCYRWSPYTTAVYYERALRAMGHTVMHCDLYETTYAAEDCEADLFLWIEAGGGAHPEFLPFKRIPTIAYYIDSHTQRIWHLPDARRYDHVFVADVRYVSEYGPNAHWLPMACDPELHTPTRTEPPEYDVAFVGNTYPGSPLYEDRRQTLAALAKRYKCRFESGVYFQDMANVYASARVVFNKSVLGDLNMRVFEAMCSGRPLVTDKVRGIEALYAGDDGRLDSVGPLCYRADAEAYEVIDDSLAAPASANDCGYWARENVLAHHTYAHRAAQMLQEAGL